ncbi:MAG: TVP38/TMEM64 family protein [Clostridia bacterium]|nr:TVP38/TMEM64 family protein [Clostridia bacterium]
MPFIYILVQIIQVLFLPIPGAISILAGLQIFGALLTGVYSYIGIVLGSLTAFGIGRRWGNKGAAWLIGEETLEAWKKKMQGKDNLLLTAMFLLPFFPDDILCFVAGVSTMSSRYFILMMLATRLFSVFTTCYSIEWIPVDTWWGLLIWGVLFALMATAFILLYKNIEKVNNFMKNKRKK